MIYFIMCFIWAIFSGYKQRTKYQRPLNCWSNVFKAGIINFVIFPYAFYLALIKGEI